ncbi:MAG: non-canonical purine NTP pyrophosphatase, partial [Treponemataceae bacterium]
MTIWFATGNAHKCNELAAILAPHVVRMPKDVGLHFDPEETGNTFLDNSLIKARALYDLVHEPVIADDSGLCVDALDGMPGVFSARYGSEN